jgi:hypothetical protein
MVFSDMPVQKEQNLTYAENEIYKARPAVKEHPEHMVV